MRNVYLDKHGDIDYEAAKLRAQELRYGAMAELLDRKFARLFRVGAALLSAPALHARRALSGLARWLGNAQARRPTPRTGHCG
jgi:hypothetical protein